MITRRKIVTSALSAIPLYWPGCSCFGAVLRKGHLNGCVISEEEFNEIYPAGGQLTKYVHGTEQLFFQSGDRHFDAALAQTLAMLSKLFEVLPGFGYYDDYDHPNAYATHVKRLNNTDGTVLIGKRYLQQKRAMMDAPEVAVAGTCAHEFGHILQFKHRLFSIVNRDQQTTKRSELQADYFAGYFGGMRKRQRPTFPAEVIGKNLSKSGNYDYDSKDFHGTPEEREAAASHGFNASYRKGLSVADAIEESTKYVMTL